MSKRDELMALIDAYAFHCRGWRRIDPAYRENVIAALDAAPTPGGEFVARVDDLERGGRVRALAMGLALDAPLYTAPPAQTSEPADSDM